MTVIAFPEIKPRYRPITVLVDLTTPLQEGDLIAWQSPHRA